MLIDHLNLRPPPQAEPLAAPPSHQTAEPARRPLSREEVVALRRAKAVASRRLPLDAGPQVSALESVGAAQARPPETDASFSCALADSAAKLAVCKNEELVRLDRHLSLFYTQSFVRADGPKRAMLLRTRGKFEAGREACRTDACLRSAYLARILEVEDIVAGSAKPRAETPAKKQVARTKTPAAKKGTQAAARAPQADASFSCSLAKTRGQIGVCKSEGLVKLDQQLSLYYTKSFLNADAARRSKLLSTRERFNTKRDGCATNACLTGAYLARIREVADIMEADRATASR